MVKEQSNKERTASALKPKRAIAISGGGPTLGIAIGALEALQQKGIHFNVYSCACIGSWVACIYLSKDGAESKTGIEHLKKVYRESFRPDDVYAGYPFAYFFQPDIWRYTLAAVEKLCAPDPYNNLFLPSRCMEFFQKWLQRPILGINDLRAWFNDFLPVFPWTRLAVALIYKSSISGIVNQPNADALAAGKIDFDILKNAIPTIYTNAYNFKKYDVEMFTNRVSHKHPVTGERYKPISAENLMAGSSLPFIYEPRCINGKWYCEGATVDTVNFKSLLENHPDLDEVWVVKIVDYKQIAKPNNLVEGISLLPMIFADTAADDDIKLFRYHLLEEGKFDLNYEMFEYGADKMSKEYKEKMKDTLWKSCSLADKIKKIKVVNIRVKYEDVNFDWNQANLERGIKAGKEAAEHSIETYLNYP